MAVNLFEPRTMLKFVDRMPKATTFLRDKFFAHKEYSPTPKVDVDIKIGGLKIAPYVSEKIGGKVVENSGYRTETFSPPLVAPLKVTTAADIQKRSMGENLYSSQTPDQRAARKLLDDLKDLDEMVTRREEVMCAQAIFNGEIDVKGDGVDYLISFGHANRETLSGANLWSAGTSTKLADLKRWRKIVQETGFVNTDHVIMAGDVAEELLKDEEILKLLNIRNVNIGQIAINELPSGATYIGYLSEVGHLYSYNAFYYNEETKKAEPLVPAGSLALLSSETDFSMAYAAITLIKDKDDDFTTYETERVPDTWVEKNPDRKMLQLSSKPLPIPKEINGWFVAKVL
ncbi:major capsid protein [Lysinibacillus fusiformis]|uniref:major capsid protein n=1 Tax=Lysinibacillus fusiformis TaxID=28031 RepID=UPI001EF621C5|nr:major capsid protein [Lysinibacillus fusiformis]MCG7435560.1 major capsid protein [Lysinibacillus fusiformis]